MNSNVPVWGEGLAALARPSKVSPLSWLENMVSGRRSAARLAEGLNISESRSTSTGRTLFWIQSSRSAANEL